MIGGFTNPILAAGLTVSMDVDFEGSTQSTDVGETISFTNLSNPTPVFNFWDFGDGSFSTASSPDKVYETDGTFSITLSAMNAVSGGIETKNDYIFIIPLPFTPYLYTGGEYNSATNIQSFSRIDFDGTNLQSVALPGNRNVWSIKVDKFSNVYVGAFLTGLNQIICKYDKDLNLLWTYDTGRHLTGSGFDFTIAIAVNENGEVAYTQGGRNPTLNIKYVGLLSSDGDLIWEINETGSMEYGPIKCLFDKDGDIITSYTGTTTSTGSGVFKWSKINGNRLWKFASPGTGAEDYTQIATGILTNDVFFNHRSGLRRLNGSTGEQIWLNNTVTPQGSSSVGGVQVNKNDEVYYFCLTSNSLGRLRKITGDNSQVLLDYNIPPWSTFGRAFELGLDNEGNFYTQQQSPQVVRKYRESDGVLLWTLTRGPGNTNFWNMCMATYPQPLKTI